MVQLTITGTVGGGNTTFTLSAIPMGLALLKNNVLQTLDTNYTLSGATITFLAGSIPVGGDTLAAVSDGAIYPPGGRPSVTVQEIYDQVCYVLCEDGGLTLGIVTEAQFLHILSLCLLDLAQRAPLDKYIFTTMISGGVSQYVVPDMISGPELCFVGGRLIEKTTEDDLTNQYYQWKRKVGVPQRWHEDNLEIKHLELFPTPNFNGTNIAGDTSIIGHYDDFYPTERNLSIVGPALPTKTTWTLSDTLDGIGPSFSPYLVFAVLEKIFNSESEARDLTRAAYCKTRVDEMVLLASALIHEELIDDDD